MIITGLLFTESIHSWKEKKEFAQGNVVCISSQPLFVVFPDKRAEHITLLITNIICHQTQLKWIIASIFICLHFSVRRATEQLHITQLHILSFFTSQQSINNLLSNGVVFFFFLNEKIYFQYVCETFVTLNVTLIMSGKKIPLNLSIQV